MRLFSNQLPKGKDLSKCLSCKCLNILQTQGGGYTCQCHSLCSGQNCETCDDPCTSGANPCFNGGTCNVSAAIIIIKDCYLSDVQQFVSCTANEGSCIKS